MFCSVLFRGISEREESLHNNGIDLMIFFNILGNSIQFVYSRIKKCSKIQEKGQSKQDSREDLRLKERNS